MADDKEEKDSHLLAGLCYVPFMMINLIVILYVLLAKKGGEYAKYHALQGMTVLIVLFFAWALIWLTFAMPMMQKQMNLQAKILQTASENSTATDLRMQEIRTESFGIFSLMIPIMAMGLFVMVALLALAVFVGIGKDIRIPILKGFLMRFV